MLEEADPVDPTDDWRVGVWNVTCQSDALVSDTDDCCVCGVAFAPTRERYKQTHNSHITKVYTHCKQVESNYSPHS